MEWLRRRAFVLRFAMLVPRGWPSRSRPLCRAAPYAPNSSLPRMTTGWLNTVGAIWRTASERAAPPTSRSRSGRAPCCIRASRLPARLHSTPSTAARAIWAGVALASVSPWRTPLARSRSRLDAFQNMAAGLVRHYREAPVAPVGRIRYVRQSARCLCQGLCNTWAK
jgi:hypothetical protein